MERPARLYGLWALLLCAGCGAVPTGECDPWGLQDGCLPRRLRVVGQSRDDHFGGGRRGQVLSTSCSGRSQPLLSQVRRGRPRSGGPFPDPGRGCDGDGTGQGLAPLGNVGETLALGHKTETNPAQVGVPTFASKPKRGFSGVRSPLGNVEQHPGECPFNNLYVVESFSIYGQVATIEKGSLKVLLSHQHRRPGFSGCFSASVLCWLPRSENVDQETLMCPIDSVTKIILIVGVFINTFQLPAWFSILEVGTPPPPVTNLSVFVENLCTIIWTWNPPEGVSPNCNLSYVTNFDKNQEKRIAPATRRLEEVALNERVCLQVRSQCGSNESEKPSDLVEKCIWPPEGDPESAVTELQCIWHNLSFLKCTWLPGRNTSPDTNYTLYYWYESLGSILQCQNFCREGQYFGCSFVVTKENDLNVQIMVKDNAGKIRPSYSIVTPSSHVKPGPPHIKSLFFQNGNLYVRWKNPQNFQRSCLSYQIEVNNTQSDTSNVFHVKEPTCPNAESEGTICFMAPGLLPDALNTVRVRVRTNTLCYEDDKIWSNWSEAMPIGKNDNPTIYITMLLIIPVIVAGTVIVLLLYLKRLKIIIFPPIPDPGKIFKEMFGDQNDDTMHWKKYDIYEKQTKEETDSVVLIENLKRASQ
ncbi:interleukin-13 receptor subunit alpha-1 [Erinaceus europaeus]|uniref:Interleukin-13 receptor subunit alpha-1 n=1 Tax=Erinaceus europaeus TaxID=9365 RepID=A0ABM3WPZ1_ERIEU|nr:interleukin-13 receptor subunit alpha-1 [Erinaceus europaeus]